MTKLRILGAATVLSMMAATPVFAQAALPWPGQFAIDYPSANTAYSLHAGVATPAHSTAAMAFLPPGKSHAKRHVTRH
ncbi:MAG: hypothetical protein I4N50_01135, partial [Rhizobium sp.]|jgi:hypothetical protein|nr:hypothetical protein [Rhizobium sp.]